MDLIMVAIIVFVLFTVLSLVVIGFVGYHFEDNRKFAICIVTGVVCLLSTFTAIMDGVDINFAIPIILFTVLAWGIRSVRNEAKLYHQELRKLNK